MSVLQARCGSFEEIYIMSMKSIQCLMGLNGASVIRGMRLGFSELLGGCRASFSAAHPLQNKTDNQIQKELHAIPEVSLDEILGTQKATIKVNVQKYEDGMFPSHEAMALLSILVAENPKEILEIGTFMGHTTRAMAENLPESIIHTVDLPPNYPVPSSNDPNLPKDDFHLIERRVVGREFKGHPVAARIRQHFGDTATLDFAECGHPTFFFIDGAHTYEYCKQDSEKCLALGGGRGTFLWHDCDGSHPGVLRFITEWRSLSRNILRIKGTAIAYWKNA